MTTAFPETLFPEPRPRPLPQVTLRMSFEDILGAKASAMTETERRERWAAWLKLSRGGGDKGAGARWWMNASECIGCDHRRGAWCKLMGLPCSVNPILSFRQGMLGMACMGAGHTQHQDVPEVA